MATNELSSQAHASKDFIVVEPFAPVELFTATFYFGKKVQPFNCLLDGSVVVEVFQGVQDPLLVGNRRHEMSVACVGGPENSAQR